MSRRCARIVRTDPTPTAVTAWVTSIKVVSRSIDSEAWLCRLLSTVALFTADGEPLSGAWS
jgi:hypothetical protein